MPSVIPPDSSSRNLQGRSFKGQDLTGVNYSYADIRGTDFTNAILIGANFSYVKAGLQHHWVIILNVVVLVLAMISGAGARFAGGIAASSPHIIILTVLAVLFIFIAKRGITADLVAFLAVIAGVLIICGAGAGALDLAGLPVGAVGLRWTMKVAWALAGTLPWALAGVLSAAVAGNLLWTLARTLPQFLVGVSVGVGIWTFAWAKVAAFFEPVALAVVFIVAVAVGVFGGYVGWCAFAEDQKFAWVRWIAVAIAATGGTSFRGADLTNANFTQSTLKSTDLRNANLTRTKFYKAKNPDQARVDNTILLDKEVRDLVFTNRGANKSYVGRNLKGANLAGADLSDADLTEADVSEATFEHAWLERANLTKTQALKTNFQQARLTGACLEAWNIDSNTQLQGVICDYVYLLNNQQERRPSSREFAPGEFTKLFQEVLNTVDLIFSNGVDWKAFVSVFKKVKVENECTELAVRSIENKGDGVLVIRVDVPADTNKMKLHADFMQTYDAALRALEEKYRAEIETKDQLIDIHRQHQADLKEVVQLLVSRPVQVSEVRTPAMKSAESKLVFLKLGQGDLNTGFPVTLQIGWEGSLPFLEFTGRLAPAPQLYTCYSQWQSAYCRSLKASFRLDIPDIQVTHVSRSELFQECDELAESLRQQLNLWLNSEIFRPVKEQLFKQLVPSESIRVILQTEDRQLRRMPFQLWDFFEEYLKAEFALSTSVYQRTETSLSPKAKVRILAILGDSVGIDLGQDRMLLEQLPDAEVIFLVEPQRQELNDQLWAQPWDILFFAGHSSSQGDRDTGKFHINKTDSLTIPQLKHALRKAIKRGLKLAIFNSCDGLGLAANLAELNIPQMIVMREPVPDQVAQEFLKNFLTEFSNGKSLYSSVREAREKLQGLEDEFPCASWLPTLFQNPAVLPGNWQEFRLCCHPHSAPSTIASAIFG